MAISKIGQWWQELRGAKGKAGNLLANAPDWYQAYARDFINTPLKSTVSDLRFTVFDTETTGLNPQQDRMVSIGAIKVQARTVATNAAFGRFLNPKEASNKPAAVLIHGLVPTSNQREYVSEAAALADFLAYLGRDVLVAHHLSFDLSMINKALARHGCGPVLNDGVDTLLIAKKLQPAAYWTPEHAYTLDHLARRYQISLSDRHTALGDSYITAILFLKLQHRLSERKARPLMLDDLR